MEANICTRLVKVFHLSILNSMIKGLITNDDSPPRNWSYSFWWPVTNFGNRWRHRWCHHVSPIIYLIGTCKLNQAHVGATASHPPPDVSLVEGGGATRVCAKQLSQFFSRPVCAKQLSQFFSLIVRLFQSSNFFSASVRLSQSSNFSSSSPSLFSCCPFSSSPCMQLASPYTPNS